MSSILLTAPAAEPLTLDEARAFLRVEHRIQVMPGPLQVLTAARVYDIEGLAHDVDIEAFVADRGASLLAFTLWAVPAPGRVAGGIELDVRVGYGDGPVEVPEALHHAIRLLVAHWYDNRGLIAIGNQGAALPATVDALIAPYRMLSL